MKRVYRKLYRWRWLLGSSLVAIVLPTLLNLLPVGSPATATEVKIPRSCIPARFPKISNPAQELEFKFVSATHYQGSEYRLYQVAQPGASAPFPYVVRLQGKTCAGVYSNPMGDPDDYFHLAMPLPVAQQLTLGRLQAAIQKAGGLPAFSARLQRSQQQYGAITEMAEEEVWAYQQVGLPVPPNVKIIRANPRP